LPWRIFGQRNNEEQPLIIELKIIRISEADKREKAIIPRLFKSILQILKEIVVALFVFNEE